MTKEIVMRMRAGDNVDFVYEGVRMHGYVTCIKCMSAGNIYFNIRCNDMEFCNIPFYNVIPSNHPEEKYFFGADMKDVLNSYYNDPKNVKDIFNLYYGEYRNKKQSIKVYQTEIKTGDRKGLYTTVLFRYHEPIVVKKDSDAANDTLIAIAYANAKRVMGSNSRFKKRADKNTIKIGKDYVVSVLSTVFVPGEVLKRKKWDIYTYVAVQELFKRFPTKDIIDAINNVTYTVKEK